jgi:hypothetical protein
MAQTAGNMTQQEILDYKYKTIYIKIIFFSLWALVALIVMIAYIVFGSDK